MTKSWPEIRGLNYSTIGRTIRATVYSSDGDESLVRFDPPTSWRIERSDGTPSYIESDSDEYRFREDGVAVHASKSPNRMVVTMGLSPTMLMTAHRLWPAPGPMARPQVGEPGEPTGVDIQGRDGWQFEFDDLHGGLPITVVIDAETGVALRWSQGEKWMELTDPVLDEEFDPGLFTWGGATIETEEQLESPEQLAHEQRMRDIAAMPQTAVSWLPMSIHPSAVDGDPLTGALDVTVTASSAQVGIRRWLTDVGEPEVGFSMDFYPLTCRAETGPWTVELRTHQQLSPEDTDRILESLILPDPPGPVERVRHELAARRSAEIEAEITERLGTGRDLDECLRLGYQSLFIRTDFTDDARWREVVLAALAPVDSGVEDYPTVEAGLTCIDNPDNDGMTAGELVDRLDGGSPYYAFLADSITISHNEMPIVALDCGRPEYGHEPGRTFRIIPSEMYSVEANWSISNMGFSDFADSADEDGIFRGFPPSPPVVTTMERDSLIALSTTNRSTPALTRFADEIAGLDRAYAVIHESARERLRDGVLQLADSDDEIRDGVDDYLAATSRDGICHGGFVQVLAGHWSLVIDPDTGRLEAAMLRKYSPPDAG